MPISTSSRVAVPGDFHNMVVVLALLIFMLIYEFQVNLTWIRSEWGRELFFHIATLLYRLIVTSHHMRYLGVVTQIFFGLRSFRLSVIWVSKKFSSSFCWMMRNRAIRLCTLFIILPFLFSSGLKHNSILLRNGCFHSGLGCHLLTSWSLFL